MERELQKVSAAFVKAQREFGPALKTNTNPHFKSRYADLSACIEAVIDALNKNGIGMIQKTERCESGVTVETVFVHESGETLSSGPLHVPASKNDAQGYGSALTYARRYSLMAACGIAPEDDDGNAASKKSPPTGSGADVKKQAFDSIQPEIQEYLRKSVPSICAAAAEDPKRAIEIAGMTLDNWPDEDRHELKKALWHLLDSKTRTAIDAIQKR